MNIFHCCVHKTASQWMAKFLADPRILESNGFISVHYFHEVSQMGKTPLDFPEKTIFTSLHSDFERFQNIRKQDTYKVFFVKRDPRDIVVSWYFSVKLTHASSGKIDEVRSHLNSLSLTEGLLFSINYLNNYGTFHALKSWENVASADPRVMVIKFEDLTSKNSIYSFKALFQHCGLSVNDEILEKIIADHSFESLTKRKPGIENQASHLRKGIEGDWVNYFDDELERKFYQVTGSLTTDLGYLDSRISILKRQLNLSQENLNVMVLKCNQYEQANQDYENQIQHLQTQLRKTQEQIQQIQCQYQKVQAQLQHSQSKLEKAKKRRKEIIQRNKHVNIKMKELRAKINNRELEVSQAKNGKVSKLKKMLSSFMKGS